MIDLSLPPEYSVLAFFIILYLVVISVAISKFHNYLSNLKKVDAKLKTDRITNEDHSKSISRVISQISKLKRRSYIQLSALGVIHIIVVIVFNFSVLTTFIVIAFMFTILNLTYWMKGSSVTGFLQNFPSTTDNHSL